MLLQKRINTRTVMTPVTNNEETQSIKKQESPRCILPRYSLLNLECHSISFSIPNPIGLFSTKLGQSNLKNLTINWDLRHKKNDIPNAIGCTITVWYQKIFNTCSVMTNVTNDGETCKKKERGKGKVTPLHPVEILSAQEVSWMQSFCPSTRLSLDLYH